MTENDKKSEELLNSIVGLLKGQSFINSKQILENAIDVIGSEAIIR